MHKRVGAIPPVRYVRDAMVALTILLAFCMSISGTGLASAVNVHQPARAGQTVHPPKYLVLIVLDGASPEYFHMTKLPHVDALRAAGTQYIRAIDGILESETPAGHTALATGSTPRRNGILGFEWAQNDNDYSLFSPSTVSSGAMEHIMAASKVPTIAGLYKSRFPSARVIAVSGHKYYAADPLGGPKADAIMYFQGDDKGRYVPVAIPGHTPPTKVFHAKGLIVPTTHLRDGQDDHLATVLALAAFKQMRQRITLINYPEFDWPLGHVYGGPASPSRAITLMRVFDQDLGKIEDAYRKAGILNQTLFVITADHGMATISRFVPQTVVTNAVSQAHTTAPAISWSNGAYVWLHDPSKAGAVAKRVVAAHDPGVQAVYYLVHKGKDWYYDRAGGLFATREVNPAERSLLGTLLNGHEPNVVVLCRNHATFSPASTHWKADHGGASWQSEHIPLILSGPGIRPHTVTSQPAQLIDVAPTVLADMGVSPRRMEGHALTEALLGAQSAAVRARAAEIRSLRPVTDALLAQEHYEASHR